MSEHKKESQADQKIIETLEAWKKNPGHLKHIPKMIIVEQIDKIANPENRTKYFRECLEKTNPLGNRCWKKEGLFDCDMKSGTLKLISDKLRSQADVSLTSKENSTSATDFQRNL